MAPRTPPEILETEWDILDALWQAERATARQVTEALQERRGWAYSTVKTLLDRMVEKNLVQARQVGNVWEYTPALPRQKAQRWAWRRLVDVAFGGATAPTLAFVAKETKLSRRDRAELRALLDQLEKQDDRSEEGEND
jgi:BlaI family transcriptional regulator, penicillinase repressor